MKWTKPNGTSVETNDAPETVEYCKSLGWAEAKPRRRPRKEVIDQPPESDEAE